MAAGKSGNLHLQFPPTIQLQYLQLSLQAYSLYGPIRGLNVWTGRISFRL